EAVDLGGVDPAVLDRGDARVERERGGRDVTAVAPEAGGGCARERDLVLGGVRVADHAAPASLNAGNGRPSRSIQVSSTGAPMTMSSFDASTTVLVKRRPSCSSSSTVTTGCGPAW